MPGIGELDLRAVPAGEGGAARCPLCREDLAGPVYECPGCATRYHAGCARFLSGCSTLGCPRKGQAVLDVDRRARRQGRRAVSRLVFMGLMAALPGVGLTVAYATLMTVYRRHELQAREGRLVRVSRARERFLDRFVGRLAVAWARDWQAEASGPDGPEAAEAADERHGLWNALELLPLEEARRVWDHSPYAELGPYGRIEPGERDPWRPAGARAWLALAVGLQALETVRAGAERELSELRGDVGGRTELVPGAGESERRERRAWGIAFARRILAGAGEPVSEAELRAWVRAALPDATPLEVERALASLAEGEASAR